MSINPQLATSIVHGAGRVRSFIEMSQTNINRPMPTIAGRQPREGNTPRITMPMTAEISPVGPATYPTMPQAQAAGASLNGPGFTCLSGNCNGMSLKGLRGWSTWPMWLKVLLPSLAIGGGLTVAVVLARRAARRRDMYPAF